MRLLGDYYVTIRAQSTGGGVVGGGSGRILQIYVNEKGCRQQRSLALNII